MATIKDVAKKANVSPSTVSRVFSRPELISEKVRRKVIKTANELNYILDSRGRNLKLNIKDTCGVIISDSENPFYLKVIHEMSKLPAYKDKKTFIMFSEEKSDLEYSSIISLLSSNVDTVFFTPTDDANPKIEEIFKQNNVSSLQLYRNKFDSLDSLIIDDCYGAYLATKTLIENGHTNIILFDIDISIPTGRPEGYKKAFKEFGLKVKNSNIVKIRFDQNFEEIIYKAIKDIKPTAIITTGNAMTHIAYKLFKENDIRVYDDISLIAYDDIDMAKYLGLTVISHPYEEIASKALEIINERKENPDKEPIHQTIKPFIILRNSVKKLN